MALDPEAFRQQIPHYLTGRAQVEFLDNLKSITRGVMQGYFLPIGRDPFTAEVLQGDGWTGLQVYSFVSKAEQTLRGVILSNSCDIDPENPRALPSRLIFAPLIRLTKLEEAFRAKGLAPSSIATRIDAIRSQSVSNIFYFPAESPLSAESVLLFDDIHSIPADLQEGERTKLFTLSMAGFYLLVFKLSVHFCRLQEGVDRRASPP